MEITIANLIYVTLSVATFCFLAKYLVKNSIIFIKESIENYKSTNLTK
jgi:hypothetical protein